MKIALIGYGKMGKAIEQEAIARGHEIVAVLDSSRKARESTAFLKKADIAIEFTRPEAAFENVCACFEADIPVVCGTTGWLNKLSEARETCVEEDKSFLHASNFSLGVNIFFELNKKLAILMNGRHEYQPFIHESHHIKKLDAPSGTAIVLANDMIENSDHLRGWQPVASGRSIDEDLKTSELLGISSERTGEVPGTHLVSYTSKNDIITIEHQALNRSGFALGAVCAAEWLLGRKGFYTMKDVLGIV